MTEDDVRKLLRDMRDEPVPAGSLRNVRLAVARRTKKRPAIWWRAAAMLAAAACLLFLLLPARKPEVVAKPPGPVPVAHRQPQPAKVLAPTTAPAPILVQPVRQPRRAVRKPAAPQPGVLIRIETPDPDVVILLIGD